MPDNNFRVAIVVPCYNESSRLPVARFEQYMQSTATEFVFVDDGSTDKTIEILKKTELAHPDKVVVWGVVRNWGRGKGFRRAIMLLSHATWTMWDSGMQT